MVGSVTLSYTIRGFFASVKLYKSSPYDKMINTNISVGLQISFACANGEHIYLDTLSLARSAGRLK